jgi:hypothetical protein
MTWFKRNRQEVSTAPIFSKGKSKRRKARAALPSVELLEDRALPSTLTTTPTPAQGVVGNVTLQDVANLSGASNPTGTISFTLYAPDGVTVVDSESVPVNGNGMYSTQNGYAPVASGTYQWLARYGGDANNNPITGTIGDEPVVVSPPPQITTSQGPNTTLGSAIPLTDTATLTGGDNPTGSITFGLYLSATGEGGSSNTPVTSFTVPVNGDGTYGPVSYTPMAAGQYQWVATYSGDSNNPSVGTQIGDEPEFVNPAQPSLTTTASPSSGPVGVTLQDTATLTGAVGPTGPIVFQLIAPDGSLVDYEEVTVNGNGDYSTTNGAVADQIGTYTWQTIYLGDANNLEADAAPEPVSVGASLTSPTISTVAGPGGVVGNALLTDTAQLGGSDSATGTIGFTLTGPDGAVVTTETVGVSGDGSYSTPTPVLATEVGTYIWSATYSGDSLNNAATDSGQNETATVIKDTPTLVTNASASAGGVVGTTQLSDSATISGGDNPTGSITFTLTSPDGTTATIGSVSIFSAGTYSSLAVTATEVGTYTWHASYTGDSLNNPAADNGANESITTVKASPTVVTSASVSAGGLVGTAQLSDSATIAGGFNPTGTITFSLKAPDGSMSTIGTVNVNGDGTYTGPAVTATEGGTYTWHATYNGDGLNNSAVDNGANESVTTIKANPAIVTSAAVSAGGVVGTAQLSDSATLSGGYNPTGTITFSLKAPDGSTSTVATVSVNGDGAYNGPAVTATEVGTYTWLATYNGDTGNNSAADDGTNESVTTIKASPSVATVASATAGGVVGTSHLSDSVIVSGGDNPTGTVTFTLKAPDGTTSTVGSVTINGDGTYSSPAVTATEVGIYTFHASYGGDALNNSAADNGTNESVTTIKASPSVATVASATAGGVIGSSHLSDSVTVSGGDNPTGTVTFTLKAPDGTTATIGTVTISGDGTYSSPSVTPTQVGTYTFHATYSGDALNNTAADNGANESVTTVASSPRVSQGEFGTIGFWHNQNGQAVINSFNGGSTKTLLGNWLASNFPHLFGASNPYISSTLAQYKATSLAGLTNAQIATVYANLWNPTGVTKNTYVQAFAVALGVYADTSSLGGNATATKYGFKVTTAGGGGATWTIGSNSPAFGGQTGALTVMQILQAIDANFTPSTGTFYGGDQTKTGDANNVLNGINTTGDVNAGLAGNSGVAFSPEQLRTAYGINGLGLDGTGQTIAVVDAYDNPSIFQAVDAFDQQFGLGGGSSQNLFDQYGASSSFLTVLGQDGQTTDLPGTDPSGPGGSNWEVESALDVEWIHAVAPGARIILVEANSQALSDLMSGVATAGNQPGVSVVSMSWGFQEGLTVLGEDEAAYDSYLVHLGVTFVASTGDYGTADPEYPAFSPNVIAVGGTSLTLNADNSYGGEAGWGYQSADLGTFIGSGGGVSQFEAQPAFQLGAQSTGYRTTPDVAFVADPATGVWIADPYNLDSSNPFEVVGGTSLSAPGWAAMMALVNQGRATAGQAALNSTSPTEAQQALYSLSQSDYNVIATGTNGGYNAAPGYNLVTGLGTPIASRLVPDIVAGNYTATGRVAAISPGLNANPGFTPGSTSNTMNVFTLGTPSGGAYRSVPKSLLVVIHNKGSATAAHKLRELQVVVFTPSKTSATFVVTPPGNDEAHGNVKSAQREEEKAPLMPPEGKSDASSLIIAGPELSEVGLAIDWGYAEEDLAALRLISESLMRT